MPKDHWAGDKAKAHTRKAAQEFAQHGRHLSYESVYDEHFVPEATPSEPPQEDKTVAWLNRMRRTSGRMGVGIPAFTRSPAKGETAAIPLLLYALSAPTPEDIQRAGEATRLIGGQAVKSLVMWLEVGSEAQQCGVAEVLGLAGSCGIPAAPELERVARNGSTRLREAAERALARLRQHGYISQRMQMPPANHARQAAQATPLRPGGTVVADLVEHLRHGTLAQQRDAALALGSLGERASSAETALEEAKASPDTLLGQIARVAFSHIKMALLLQDLESGLQHRQKQAVAGLREYTYRADLLVPKLTKLLRHDTESVRVAAAEALSKFGPHATAALPALKEARRKGGSRLQRVVSEAIKAIDPRKRCRPGTK
jgi:HEAT repeat protein